MPSFLIHTLNFQFRGISASTSQSFGIWGEQWQKIGLVTRSESLSFMDAPTSLLAKSDAKDLRSSRMNRRVIMQMSSAGPGMTKPHKK